MVNYSCLPRRQWAFDSPHPLYEVPKGTLQWMHNSARPECLFYKEVGGGSNPSASTMPAKSKKDTQVRKVKSFVKWAKIQMKQQKKYQ